MNIIVLCGGNSTEREVSINSGYNICEALRSKGHNAVLLDAFFGTKNSNVLQDAQSGYDALKERDAIRNMSEKLKEEADRKKLLWRKCNRNLFKSRYCVYGASWKKRRRRQVSGGI